MSLLHSARWPLPRRLLTCAVAIAGLLAAAATPAGAAAPPPLGANVIIFNPTMSTSDIQAAASAVATAQLSNQFGPQRYALLFEPGTYGSATAPLNFQVGYYTSVAGLGQSPGDVVINGSVDVYNQCDTSGSCIALNNFWRSLSNLTINVTKLNAGCYARDFWAVSQAAPMRRVQINGDLTLMDYCTNPSFASGGFIADSAFAGGIVVNGSQQQFMVRNSNLDSWTNGVWNQVFSGTVGAPANCFPAAAGCGGPYTTLAASPVTREAPYLYIDGNGRYAVFVPGVQRNSVGTTWANGATPGRSLLLSRFHVAQPTDTAATLNAALAAGQNLLLTPGVYALEASLVVTRPDTLVLGLGFPTLIPQNGTPAITVANGKGMLLSGMIIDAGPKTSPVLVRLGTSVQPGEPLDPSALHDVFFRIGGAAAGSATVSLEVNSSDVILDDVWAWRADHGNGVGWTVNTADTGLVVNGDAVTAYGLFVEHYQKYEVIWRGKRGTTVFFQNEMPYDPPSQAAWMEPHDIPGWAAMKVTTGAAGFTGYGMGSYCNFTAGADIYAASAFEVPGRLAPGSLHDLLTVFLNTTSKGGILDVVNRAGGPALVANPDQPVTVVSYP